MRLAGGLPAFFREESSDLHGYLIYLTDWCFSCGHRRQGARSARDYCLAVSSNRLLGGIAHLGELASLHSIPAPSTNLKSQT